MTGRGRPEATTVAGLVLGLFDLAWFLIGLVHQWAHPIVGWIPLPFGAALAAYACRRVTRRGDLARATRRFWGQMGLACAALALAIVSNAADAFRGGEPTQWISSRTLAIYLLILGVAIWALLRLPAWQRTRRDWFRFALDAGILLLANSAFIWHYSLRKIDLWASQTGSALPTVAISLVASISMLTFIKVVFAGAGELDRRALHILSWGVAASAVSGSVSIFITDRPYLSTTFLAAPLAAMAAQTAANRQFHAAQEAPGAPPPARHAGVLPYLAAAGMSALLIAVVAPGGGEVLTIVIWAVAMTVLVMVRQFGMLRENGRLLRTVDANLRQLRDYQAQLAHQVSHDTLTEIPNRALFNDRVTAQLADGQPFHVALLDLDDFKVINDRLGHGTGDALLKVVSRRLHERMRPTDTVARLGGDEFTLLLPGRTADETAVLMRELVAAVQQPVLLHGQDMVVRISAGVTTAHDGDTPEELIRRADVAMYSAKQVGGGRTTWFDPMMDKLADADAQLGHDLRQALARDELFVLYQPIVELPHGGLAGVEALVRWRHPEHGLVSPAIFIPVAERNGSIVDVGWWILEQVVHQAAAWEREYGPHAPEKVSVNISARQLGEPGFADRVAALLRETGLTPYRLVAEVTETAVLGTGEALDAVHELHGLGMRVALDDFGTGQSSLSLLVDTPVRVLKVDKSFVDGVTVSSPQAVIVDGLIGITDGLAIEAVAEGVETAEQAHRLHAVGYRYAQGFHFARPMPPEDVALLLDQAPISVTGNLDNLN
ncbi:bifunctional diguanylate cyclase/phosphodiesterase [Actinoplanes sp. NPDC051411]|uniref:putative bifunctional diguanylate cyclase/phosphodiesterase n=1 Tax=Actinoplanes sp. NPDC051411 TaxID=3155522 RepID=UPI003415E64F